MTSLNANATCSIAYRACGRRYLPRRPHDTCLCFTYLPAAVVADTWPADSEQALSIAAYGCAGRAGGRRLEGR